MDWHVSEFDVVVIDFWMENVQHVIMLRAVALCVLLAVCQSLLNVSTRGFPSSLCVKQVVCAELEARFACVVHWLGLHIVLVVSGRVP
jgi:hypothetical protein